MIKERIFKLISESGKSERSIALEIGLNITAFSNWKRLDNATPSAEAILKIADYFGVSADYLLGRTNDSSPPVNLIKTRDNSGIINTGNINGNISIGSQQQTRKCKDCEKLKKQLRKILD